MDGLGLERASRVGNCFGGALALSIATTFPERVANLVLMGSIGAPFPITPGLEAVWGLRTDTPRREGALERFACDRDLATHALAELRLQAATRPGVHEAYHAM